MPDFPAPSPTNRLGLPPAAALALMCLVAFAGGWAVDRLGAPAGWLSGSMIATAVFAALNLAAPLPASFRWIAMVLSGIVIGSAVNPGVMKSMAAYPLSMVLMMGAVASSTFACERFLVRFSGWTQATGFFASVPGALSYVLALASADPRADLRRVAVVQVLRVFLLMGLAPLIVAETSAARPAGLPGQVDSLATLAVLLPLGAAVGYLFERLNVAAGLLFGAMLVSGLAHGLAWAPGRPPAFAAIGAQVSIGLWVGARFINFEWGLLGRSLAAALGAFALALAVSSVFAAGATFALGIPFPQTMIAFAPGGLEAMTLLAFSLGLDPLYVGAHHLVRFMAISMALPFVVRLRARRDVDRSTDAPK